LLEAIEPLPGGTTISALRWGPALVPLNLKTAPAEAPELVDVILEKTEQWLGAKASCYTGRGVLVVSSDR
jgi:hypothetical protein